MQNRISTILPGNDTVRTYPGSRPPVQLNPADRRPDPVSAAQFVDAMRGAATGVNIVTTNGTAGRFGVTVSAFASVSAEPPMVLVCINRGSPVSGALATNGCFAVNVLATSQQRLADTFAGNPDGGAPYDFNAARWKGSASGAPVLSGAVAGFDCVLATTVDAGTHRIFIGSVVDVSTTPTAPLLYSNRRYGHVGRQRVPTS
jgi:flavin reductase (DIM6/NTAB) family NADH-FMN oxidoreductase RutF